MEHQYRIIWLGVAMLMLFANCASSLTLEEEFRNKQLTVKNVRNFLRKRGFKSAEAELLGTALAVPSYRQQDILANRNTHGVYQLAVSDIIQYWLNNDVDANWEKLATALEDDHNALAKTLRESADKSFTLTEILKALKDFPPNEVEALAVELDVPVPRWKSIVASRGLAKNADMVLADIIQAWLDNDLNRDWDKLYLAVDNLGYKSGVKKADSQGVKSDGASGSQKAKTQGTETDGIGSRNVNSQGIEAGSTKFNNGYSWLKILLCLGGVAIIVVLLYIRFYNGSHGQVNASRAKSQKTEGDAINPVKASRAKSQKTEGDAINPVKGSSRSKNLLYLGIVIAVVVGVLHQYGILELLLNGDTSNEESEEATPKPTTDTKPQNIEYILQDIEYFDEITSEPYLGLDFRKVHGVGIKGGGVKLAIIDSCDDKYDEGIYDDHEALRKSSDRIHLVRLGCGSHTNHALTCASIAAGESFPEAIYVKKGRVAKVEYPGGIAPEVSVTLFLMNSKNRSTIHEALDHVNKGNFDVLSMSFVYYERDDDFEKRLDQLKGRTIVVAAAGNSGNSKEVGYPARLADVISVGSLNKNFKISSFSPENEGVDIYYPGEVMSPVDDTKNTIKFTTGTSVATPGVAGIVCLLVEIANHHKCKREMKEKMKAISLLKHVVITEKHGVFRYNMNFLGNAYSEKNLFKQAMLNFSTNSAK